jgi:ABC-type phosphate/phosphonate transport system substrate-binding protein
MIPISRRRFAASLGAGLALGAVCPPAAAQASLHLVLTLSQKPTDLLTTGEEFGHVLGKLVGIPVRVTVASDYAAVIEALRDYPAASTALLVTIAMVMLVDALSSRLRARLV